MDAIWNICNAIVVIFELLGFATIVVACLGIACNEEIGIGWIQKYYDVLFKFDD